MIYFLLRFSPDVAPEGKAARLVEYVDELLGPQYLRARHVALLMEKFPSECCVDKVPMFSTYRVEIVVSLFSRIYDIHNFELVLRVMKPHEIAYLNARLGRLNLFNPMKPVQSMLTQTNKYIANHLPSHYRRDHWSSTFHCTKRDK